MNDNVKFDKKIGALDWGIVLSIIVLFFFGRRENAMARPI